ncbi:hypothetical protein AAIH46_05460 [Rhizobium sp. 0TCS1.26]|uniref:hypothetical protein n=1 Tax=Rhizobium sp. 0TCS1.26 TaxID=3142623 RepID=UPI003D2B2144
MPTAKTQSIDANLSKHVLRSEIYASLPDMKDPEVLARVKASIAALDPEEEHAILEWMEKVADWGEDESGWMSQE